MELVSTVNGNKVASLNKEINEFVKSVWNSAYLGTRSSFIALDIKTHMASEVIPTAKLNKLLTLLLKFELAFTFARIQGFSLQVFLAETNDTAKDFWYSLSEHGLYRIRDNVVHI